ncbi:MAG: alpha/beta hydrolase family protein [Rubrivivax sp.]|nr:alpha/beta hydrolase family protein [Rubrivivax sp.]
MAVPWWERLPDAPHRRVGHAGLGLRQRLQVQWVAALERVARVPLSSAVAAATAASLAEPGRVRQEFEALRFYEPLARSGDASRVFAPPQQVAIGERPLATVRSKGVQIQRRALHFASPFVPLNPAAAPGIARMKRSAVAHAEHWCHGDGPRPTLIVVHGFGASMPWLNAHALSLRQLYRSGHDVLLFTFPHHGPRAEARLPFNGHGVFGNGLLHFVESTLLAIHDLRVLINHLRSRGVARIGVAGISLGGSAAALLASVDDRLDYCIPVVPGVSPIDAFLEWQPTGMLLTRLMRSQGIGVDEMRGLMAVHNPLSYASPMAGERVLIIGGIGDRVTAPHHVELLHRHWPGSTMHWFPGSHLLHFGRGEYLRLMHAHIDRWSMA